MYTALEAMIVTKFSRLMADDDPFTYCDNIPNLRVEENSHLNDLSRKQQPLQGAGTIDMRPQESIVRIAKAHGAPRRQL